MAPTRTENLHIREFRPLPTPRAIKQDLPLQEAWAQRIAKYRRGVADVLAGEDERFLVIVGPCSIHDQAPALEYARRLAELQECWKQQLVLIMRCYFEKPRTSVGWKGLLYDPNLDETDDIETGLRLSRQILSEVSACGVAAATEILDPIVPQYLSDLVTWASIGARTAESQIHRQMASGLSMPIGIKNSTDGNLDVAIHSIISSRSPHAFLGIDSEGRASIAGTTGNPFAHLVLRGGNHQPNYAAEYVAFAEIRLHKAGITNGLIIDCSHANSGKNYQRQRDVFMDVAEQKLGGQEIIKGVMVESFLEEGRQNVTDGKDALVFGQSVTDACLGWEETENLINWLGEELAR